MLLCDKMKRIPYPSFYEFLLIGIKPSGRDITQFIKMALRTGSFELLKPFFVHSWSL